MIHIIDIGHTAIKVYIEATDSFIRFDINNKNDFLNYIIKHVDNKFYVGSVNLRFNKTLIDFFKQHQINYYFIKQDDFKQLVPLNQKISLDEIGLDILSIAYYTNDQDYIFINAGTATIIMKYTNMIDGVILGPNVVYGMDKLLNITGLTYNFNGDVKTFGTDTSDSFSGYMNSFFVDPIIKLMQECRIKKLYLNQIDESLFKHIDNIEVKTFEYATLKGYIKLVKQLKEKF